MPSIPNIESENLSQRYSFDIFLEKAQRYCAYQERSVFQTETKLKEWGANLNTSKKVISYLKEHGFLSDDRFAELFTISKMKYNKWGRNKIINQLIAHKIDKDIINHYIKLVDKELYMEILEGIIIKKNAELQKVKETYIRKQKIIQFCLSKGFEIDMIMKTIDVIKE